MGEAAAACARLARASSWLAAETAAVHSLALALNRSIRPAGGREGVETKRRASAWTIGSIKGKGGQKTDEEGRSATNSAALEVCKGRGEAECGGSKGMKAERMGNAREGPAAQEQTDEMGGKHDSRRR